jgi:hypothetical protein
VDLDWEKNSGAEDRKRWKLKIGTNGYERKNWRKMVIKT